MTSTSPDVGVTVMIDNYDSFTYNLVHLIEKVSDIQFEVHRTDKISIQDVNRFDKILLSPGPGLPKDAGILPHVLKTYSGSKSIFGVCLGLQAIAENFGGQLKNLKQVYHGIATPVNILVKDTIFDNCPDHFLVGRYHSWAVDQIGLPAELEITSVDEQGDIMSLRHKSLDVRGVQFHPESILSEHGETILKNWLGKS